MLLQRKLHNSATNPVAVKNHLINLRMQLQGIKILNYFVNVTAGKIKNSTLNATAEKTT